MNIKKSLFLNKIIVLISMMVLMIGMMSGSVLAYVTGITVTYPSQSELILNGDIDIQWDITVDGGGETQYTSYDIAYSLDNGINWVSIEQGVPRGTRNYLWTTNSFHDTIIAKIRVREFSSMSEDISDNSFEIDNTAPSAIDDLAATSVPNGEIKLEWTATGDDDGVGDATSYIIKYSDLEITTQEEFDSATTYSQSYIPSEVGNPESEVLTGFSDGNTYYFAIKAVDNAGNQGGLSNSPDATSDATLPTATLTITPEDLTNLDEVIFTELCSDDGSGLASCIVEVNYDGGEYVSATSPYTLTNDGTYNFRLTATDNAGNTNTSTKQVVRDTEAPIITIDNDVSGTIWTVGGSLPIATTCTDNYEECVEEKYYYSDDETVICFEIPYESYDGTKTTITKKYACAAAKDEAGNIGYSDVKGIFRISATIQGAITAADSGDTINVDAVTDTVDLIRDETKTHIELIAADKKTTSIKVI